MNTSFERSKQTTDEWYTPKWIVDALGGGKSMVKSSVFTSSY